MATLILKLNAVISSWNNFDLLGWLLLKDKVLASKKTNLWEPQYFSPMQSDIYKTFSMCSHWSSELSVLGGQG